MRHREKVVLLGKCEGFLIQAPKRPGKPRAASEGRPEHPGKPPGALVPARPPCVPPRGMPGEQRGRGGCRRGGVAPGPGVGCENEVGSLGFSRHNPLLEDLIMKSEKTTLSLDRLHPGGPSGMRSVL